MQATPAHGPPARPGGVPHEYRFTRTDESRTSRNFVLRCQDEFFLPPDSFTAGIGPQWTVRSLLHP
jgi:hypothetical protein